MEDLADPPASAGFVFISDESPGYLKTATAGTRVTLPVFTPPWIVVDHALERVPVTGWPGRLFRVQAVPPTTDEERAAMARAAAGLASHAGYTRAIAVDLLEELSSSVLFGPHGDAVRHIIEAGSALDEGRARALESARHPAAEGEYGRAWDRWLAEQPEGAAYRNQDHVWTLSIPGAGPSGSPIGDGFSLIWRMVGTAAQDRGSAGSFTLDEDGDQALADPWDTALGALLDAAMALGAPHLTDSDAVTVLTAAWNRVFEPRKHAGTDAPQEQA
ncbi:hypothetical protein [Streptomyces inhibens]|uniref:hypothetical protein n=1 Tax=Streptomyces inhibens TaxID=2293571 RepID=UPI001EE698AE|nr:hypothetical protein [Streptomyces inhibens]UKY53067.1 hypothetical protein KI385_32555 [Streptomyces inhibens]